MNPARPYKTRKEIADDMGISLRTFYRRIKELDLNLPQGKMLKPSEYDILVKRLSQ